jgi:hypothetical protein
MTKQEYRNEMEVLYKQLDNLTEHGDEAIRITAEQMEGMNADLNLGKIEIDVRKTNKHKIRNLMLEIEDLSFGELENSLNIEKAYDGSMSREAWSYYAKHNRCQLLIKQYALLCRLRNDDPEAWEQLNELFYDD